MIMCKMNISWIFSFHLFNCTSITGIKVFFFNLKPFKCDGNNYLGQTIVVRKTKGP